MSTTTETVPGGATEQVAKRRKAPLSEGARAERRLGWLLCAPAVIVMIAVTAFPIGYAIYLSLLRDNLELPNDTKFIGLSNYAAVLTSPYWWQALKVTVVITIFSVAISWSSACCWPSLMHRTTVRPRHGPHRRRSSRTGS